MSACYEPSTIASHSTLTTLRHRFGYYHHIAGRDTGPQVRSQNQDTRVLGLESSASYFKIMFLAATLLNRSSCTW